MNSRERVLAALARRPVDRTYPQCDLTARQQPLRQDLLRDLHRLDGVAEMGTGLPARLHAVDELAVLGLESPEDEEVIAPRHLPRLELDPLTSPSAYR
jgi:hypothetical protein